VLSGGHLYSRALRRALRSAGIGRRFFSRRPTPPLPGPLRERLLAIPGATPHSRASIALQLEAADASPIASWWLTSPLASIAASVVLALAVSFVFGNPYQAGAATLDEVKSEISPAAIRLCAGASRLAEAATGAREAAFDALPRAGISASRAISRTVQGRVGSDLTDTTTDSQPDVHGTGR
jgi:hypothetical protein